MAIADYIARGHPARALSFVQELTDTCASLATMPLSYLIVPRYEARGLRRRVHGNCQIFYRVTDDLVFVVRVLHGARNYEALF